MSDQLTALKQYTTIVADTGDIASIHQYQPEDATTNPSLLLKAAAQPQYDTQMQQAFDYAKSTSNDPEQQLIDACDQFSVLIGKEILGLIPGRVSTEVDARLSFDTEATINKAHKLVNLYRQLGVPQEKILIKIASTWEGIRAAEQLERSGIQCNLTLLFNFAQARACAEAGVFLISPFIGRILDWYKNHQPETDFSGVNDPGVQSVRRIFEYYKEYGYQTIVMGASFRTKEQILNLAGCDRLTISPALLQELKDSNDPVEQALVAQSGNSVEAQALSEKGFRWELNEDAMATEKLAEGIRGFAADQKKLENLFAARL